MILTHVVTNPRGRQLVPVPPRLGHLQTGTDHEFSDCVPAYQRTSVPTQVPFDVPTGPYDAAQQSPASPAQVLVPN